MSINTAQIRAARGLLNWTQSELARRTNISTTSIGSIENGETNPRESTITIIQKAFEDAGIEFLPNQGLHKRTGHVRILAGKQGFQDFFHDVYLEAQVNPGVFLVNNVDEKLYMQWFGEMAEIHMARMKELEIKYQILIREGDTNYAASEYADYRWLPKEMFSSVSFYVYGKKLAIIVFDNEPVVMVMEYPAVTEAYRKQFATFWEAASKPE